MCRANSCCCNTTASAPLGLAAAVVAGVALVSAEAAFFTDLIVAVASAALAAGLVVASYVAWRVRVLTRPAQPAPAAQAVAVCQVRALRAAAPRAIDPPRPLPAPVPCAAGLPVKEDS